MLANVSRRRHRIALKPASMDGPWGSFAPLLYARVNTHLLDGPKIANRPMTCKLQRLQLRVRGVKVCRRFDSKQHPLFAAVTPVKSNFLHFKRL